MNNFHWYRQHFYEIKYRLIREIHRKFIYLVVYSFIKINAITENNWILENLCKFIGFQSHKLQNLQTIFQTLRALQGKILCNDENLLQLESFTESYDSSQEFSRI